MSEIHIKMSEIQVKNKNDETADETAAVQPGFLKRLLMLFVSPGKLMACLAEKPRVLFWFIFGSLAMDMLYVSRWELYKDFMRTSALASSSYMESSFGVSMTPEMVEASLPSSMISGVVFTPVTMIITMLFIALVFFAILKLMGGQGKFKAYLSVVVHSNIISVLYILLLIPISFITGSLMQGAPLTSLATLVSQDTTNPILYGILASLDVFNIWYYIVLAIGFTTVSKLKKKYVYGVTAGIFLISMIIGIVGMQAAKAIM